MGAILACASGSKWPRTQDRGRDEAPLADEIEGIGVVRLKVAREVHEDLERGELGAGKLVVEGDDGGHDQSPR
jgi:hypothetical protein